MTVDKITVGELDKYSDARAEDMDLRHKDCAGRLELKVFNNNGSSFWHLKCPRCHEQTVVNVGGDTKAIAITAIDGQMRTLSNGQTVEQVIAPRSRGFG
jgi:hypothetical protein